MIRTLTMILFASALALTGCGNRNQAPDRGAMKFQIETYQDQWGKLRDKINGNYKMTYQNIGVEDGLSEDVTVEVQDDQVRESGSSAGALTVEDVFAKALEIVDDPNCLLSISFDAKNSIIKSYSGICGNEGSGIVVTNFERDQTPEELAAETN